MGRPRKNSDDDLVNCRKCGATLGRMVYNGQALAMGAALVWNRLRVFCSTCDLPVTWQPLLPRGELTGERKAESERIRKALGHEWSE
jgi:hypothetical protein